MSPSAQFLNPAEAARRLGVSAKALRLYEQRGLLVPLRTAAKWRVYGPDQMDRAAEIAALRALGLSLAQTARVLGGDAASLEPALAAHQAMLERRAGDLAATVQKVRSLRADLANGTVPAVAELARLMSPAAGPSVAFDLPWPWGGERFELRDIPALTYIVGPLGSGKTRLALRLAETLPGAAFLGLDRAVDGEPAPKARVDHAVACLVEDGAVASDALVALLAGLESAGPAAVVVDLVEQGLDEPTQEALIAHLRRRGPGARPLPDDALVRHPRPDRRERRRGDHPVPRQSQPADAGRPLSGRARLRGRRHLPGLSRGSSENRGRRGVAAAGGLRVISSPRPASAR